MMKKENSWLKNSNDLFLKYKYENKLDNDETMNECFNHFDKDK